MESYDEYMHTYEMHQRLLVTIEKIKQNKSVIVGLSFLDMESNEQNLQNKIITHFASRACEELMPEILEKAVELSLRCVESKEQIAKKDAINFANNVVNFAKELKGVKHE